MILLIDNYDSFSYNLFQLIGQIEPDIRVIRNDAMSADEILNMKPECIILSPGPGKPDEAGVMEELIEKTYKDIPILGVCLGHQAICETFGAKIGHASRLMHGKASFLDYDKDHFLFAGCDYPLKAARYHSLAADKETMPECLNILASSPDGEIMAVEHKDYPVFGLQFHPESVLTPQGKTILENFIKEIRK